MTKLPLARTLGGATDRDPVGVARRWLDEQGAVAVATVTETWGSSPVPAGGQLVIAPDERFEGSVSGGCVEAAVLTEASAVIAGGNAKLLNFGVEHETAWRAGIPCGGRIEVLIQRMAGAEDKAHLDALLAARTHRSALVVETVLASGQRRIVGDAHEYGVETARRLASGDSFTIDRGGARVFLHAQAPSVHLIIVGAGHIAQVLSDLARRVGMTITVVDPRTAFATDERFNRVTLNHDWPETALPALGLDARTAVVTLTHADHLDDQALRAALASPCFYVGALGAKRTHDKRLERLAGSGISAAALERIDAPIGLPIGAKGPAEIALAILAAVVAAQRKA
ncbi:MAG: XdhC family protein [Hyphomicrobium sp.]